MTAHHSHTHVLLTLFSSKTELTTAVLCISAHVQIYPVHSSWKGDLVSSRFQIIEETNSQDDVVQNTTLKVCNELYFRSFMHISMYIAVQCPH